MVIFAVNIGIVVIWHHMLLSLISMLIQCAGAMLISSIELMKPMSELPVSCVFRITEKDVHWSPQGYAVALSGRYSGVDAQTCVTPHSCSTAWLSLQRFCLSVDQCYVCTLWLPPMAFPHPGYSTKRR